MPSLSTLPVEILCNIIEALTKGWTPLADLCNVSLVSKQMREISFTSLNPSYVIRDENDIRQLCERVEHEVETSYIGLHIADALKEIKGSENLAVHFSRETFRRLASILRHLHRLESFSCIHWMPDYPEDLFPAMFESCPNIRKLEVGLLPLAFPTGLDPGHVNGRNEYNNTIFCFRELTHVRVVTCVSVTIGDANQLSACVPPALLHMLDRCPRLQSLDIELNVYHEGNSDDFWQIDDLLWNKKTDSLRQWPETLRKLGIGYAASSERPHILRDFIRSHPNIEELVIVDSAQEDSSNLVNVIVQSGSLPRLKVLGGPPRICNSVLSQMPDVQLQSLWVMEAPEDGSEATPELDTGLVAQRGATVTSVRVDCEYNLYALDLKQIAEAMPRLDSLHLTGYFGGTKAQLAKALKAFTNLRCLNLSLLVSLEDIHIKTPKKMQAAIDLIAKACPRLEYIAGDPRDPGPVVGIVIRHQAGAEPQKAPKAWLQRMARSRD